MVVKSTEEFLRAMDPKRHNFSFILFLILFILPDVIYPQQPPTPLVASSEELEPFELMGYIHHSEPREAAIHQFSRNILSVTRDLVAMTSRSHQSKLQSVQAKLKELQELPESQVQALLAQQNIIVPPLVGVSCPTHSHYYRTLDGSCNNLQHPCWGKADEPFRRWLPPSYGNGVDSPRLRADGTPLPCPRTVYRWVSSQLEESDNSTSDRQLTNLVVTWGQLLAHDMLLTPTVTVKAWNGKRFKDKVPNCCSSNHPDCFPIRLDDQDGYYPSGHCMDVVRSAAYTYSPFSCTPFKLGLQREQMNQLTSYVDASFIYGSSESQMRKLREGGGFKADLLMDYHDGFSYPPRANKTCKVTHSTCDKRCFLTGEKRTNENPVLGVLQTMWSREHNRLVASLRHRGWPEETLFHVARKIVSALMQHITYHEYLPVILGPTLIDFLDLTVPSLHYEYKETVNPTLFNAFVTAAFRFGHSMVGGHHQRSGYSSPLSRDFFSMDDFCQPPADAVKVLLAAQAEQAAQGVDAVFSKQVTNHLFAKNENGRGMDLFSVNIQRGRDHGIPPYNQWRVACGLPAAKDFSDLKGTIPDYVIDRLAAVYGPGGIEEVDLYVAGVSEFPVNGGVIGPTFTCIIANQFKNLKFGDRFWYENTKHPGAFSEAQIQSIQRTTLAGLICRNSPVSELQPHVFHLPGMENPKISCDEIRRHTDLDLSVWL